MKRAFTLLEILVVIAIVALLAALFVPLAKNIRNHAKGTAHPTPVTAEVVSEPAVHIHNWGRWSDQQGIYNGGFWQSRQCKDCGLQEGHMIDMSK